MTNYTGTEARYPNQGRALLALRADRKISRSTLSKACNSTSGSIRAYETGMRRPNGRNRNAIAVFYGVPQRALFGSKLGLDIASVELALRTNDAAAKVPSLWRRLRNLFSVGQA